MRIDLRLQRLKFTLALFVLFLFVFLDQFLDLSDHDIKRSDQIPYFISGSWKLHLRFQISLLDLLHRAAQLRNRLRDGRG